MSLVGRSVVLCGVCVYRLLSMNSARFAHLGAPSGVMLGLFGGHLGTFVAHWGRHRVSFWSSVGVIHALLWREGCHKGSDEGKCGRVVSMDVLEYRKYT